MQQALTVAYLINQYPQISHSFIRREILGVEAGGVRVIRFSIRGCRTLLVDEADKLELEKTQVVLDVGILKLLAALLRVTVIKPISFLKALWLAITLGWVSERGILRHLVYLAEACVLLHWFAESKVTHVHAHFGTNSTMVAMLCHVIGGPPYSFTVHGPEEFDKVKAIALVDKIERATFVVTVSSFGKSQVYRWCKEQLWSKIHVIRCGVDHKLLAEQPVAIPPELSLVCVGRLCPEKGQLLLLDAARQLVAEGLKFKLILVGDGPLRTTIESLIIQLHLQDYVRCVGWATSSEVRQHILNSRAMVLPSFAEGLPVVIMEALALGRPVLSTYVAGIPELVEPGVCGWLVPSGSVEALVTVMRTALQLPVEKLEQMGKLGYERVAQQHDAIVEAGRLAALFQSNTERSNGSFTEKGSKRKGSMKTNR